MQKKYRNAHLAGYWLACIWLLGQRTCKILNHSEIVAGHKNLEQVTASADQITEPD